MGSTIQEKNLLKEQILSLKPGLLLRKEAKKGGYSKITSPTSIFINLKNVVCFFRNILAVAVALTNALFCKMQCPQGTQ